MSTSSLITTLIDAWYNIISTCDNDKIAIEWLPKYGEIISKITYHQLALQCKHVAKGLLALKCRRNIIAVSISEGPELTIAQLAILISGNTYLPIDLDDPRSKLMLEECKPQCIIVNATTHNAIPFCIPSFSIQQLYEKGHHDSEETEDVVVDSKQPSHIFYTSGSTGQPKGVLVAHESLLAFVKAKVNRSQIDSRSRIFLASAFTFDPNLGDTMCAVYAGATLCIGGRSGISGGYLSYFLQTLHVSHVCMTPTLWNLRGNVGISLDHHDKYCIRDFPDLKELSLGGEPMPPKLVDTARNYWKGKIRLVNTYGVTEATVYQTAMEVVDDGACVGAPYPEVFLGLIDDSGSIAWLNQAYGDARNNITHGEIVLGGIQIGLGYVNNESLSAERFLVIDGLRVYKTGDLGVFDEARQYIKFRGRSDSQIKLRGVRIELGEIEAILSMCTPLVSKCAVMVHEPTQQLVAFISTPVSFQFDFSHTEVSMASIPRCMEVAIYAFCEKHLPRPMIPTRVIAVADFTKLLTVNGKLNRLMLSRDITLPVVSTLDANSQNMSTLERYIAWNWQDKLDVEEDSIGPWDSFIQLGGDSLDAQKTCQTLVKYLSEHLQSQNDNKSDAAMIVDTLLHQSHTYGELSEFITTKDLLTAASLRSYVTTLSKNPSLAKSLNELAVNLQSSRASLPTEMVEHQNNECMDDVDEEDASIVKKSLFAACSSGLDTVVETLVNPEYVGYDPDAHVSRHHRARTPLHVAVANGHLCVLEILLKHGAYCFATTADKVPPSHVAAGSKHKDAFHILKCLTASMRKCGVKCPGAVRDGRKQTLLHAAARGGNGDILAMLLEESSRDFGDPNSMKALVNSIDRFHRSALHWAIINSNMQCVKLLVDAGANANQFIPRKVARRGTFLPYESPKQLALRTNQSNEMISYLSRE